MTANGHGGLRGEVLAIRHVAFEDLGILEPLLNDAGYRVRYIEAATTAWKKLDPLRPALVIVLGGPIGVYEEGAYPFLRYELAFIERRLGADLPLLGICLGCQLIARALGAHIYPVAVKEIGWGPVELTSDGKRSCLKHLCESSSKSVPVLHWHGDTYDLPDGALHLASSPICEQQGFSWGSCTLALQFHVEVAGSSIEQWLIGHAVEIAATPDVTVAKLRRDTAKWAPNLLECGELFFREWLSERVLSDKRGLVCKTP